MLTTIALIISSITSCVCIIVAVRQTRSANNAMKYYEGITKERDRLVGVHSRKSIELIKAKSTLKQIRELVDTDSREVGE